MAAPASKALKQARERVMTLEVQLADSVRRHSETIALNETLKKNIEGGNTTLNEFAQQKANLSKRCEQHERDLEALRAELASQKRLNALQDGYIQRTNEDEDRRDNRNSFRNGPALRGEAATVMYAESDFASRLNSHRRRFD